MPVPVLRVEPKSFCYDYFALGLTMTSARLRDAMSLPPENVHYIDVDCSNCPEGVQAMTYKVLEIRAFANPLDRERTGPGTFIDVETPAGPTFVWKRETSGPHAPTPRIAWREDFLAPAPLFQVPGTNWTLATEALAERVTRAGITDVMFLDVRNNGMRAGMLPKRP
ncbi:hypothetical protein ACSBM8_00465 [Sphingomonas sp. ASY06-1R]|uniref:hypothetical protein n=1 Tax=Sphingomonas sp. ASY06-1R TaxID=3445771 RepID=UPI003FA33E8E